jgi:hypothetical protein
LTGHKKIRLCDDADAALSVLIILSDRKRRSVKRFFVYRSGGGVLPRGNLSFLAGLYGAVFAKMLIAQRAFIEELESQLIQIKTAIFGGKRFVLKTDSS